MRQEHRAEATPVARPRAPTAGAASPRRPGSLLTTAAAPARGTAAEDVSRHRDTPAGDLAFLARFAFGRY